MSERSPPPPTSMNLKKSAYLTGGEVGGSFRSNPKIFIFLYLIRVFLEGIQLKKSWLIPSSTTTTNLHLISDEDELDGKYKDS